MDMCVLCKGCQELYDINNNSEKKKFCKKCYMKQYNKKYYVDNTEKRKEQNKQYYVENRQKRKEQKKQWNIDNRELVKEKNKQYNIVNHEKITILNWKRIGLIELEGVYTYESLYEYYVSINECEVCNKKFKNSRDRCMDHSHTTNIFRWVLCRNCNNKDNWENLI